MNHIVSLARAFDVLRRRRRATRAQLPKPRVAFFLSRCILSEWDIFESTCNGSFDDARRSNAGATACETRRHERNYCYYIERRVLRRARRVTCEARRRSNRLGHFMARYWGTDGTAQYRK